MAESPSCRVSINVSRDDETFPLQHCSDVLLRAVDPEDDILEMLRSIEELEDESFPYYTLVRWLRSSIQEHLEDLSLAPDDPDPAAWRAAARDVYNSIMESPQMVQLLERIRRGTSTGDSLSRELQHLSLVPSRRSSVCDSEGEDGWWSSSITPQQYQQLAEDIASRKATSTRVEALRVILSSHVADAVEGQHWTQLRRGLKEALCDENEMIFSLGIKIHAKLLTLTMIHTATKEAFTNLIDSVCTQYMSRKMLPHLPTVDSGLDLSKPLHYRLVKILQLISEAQREIPREWSRFSPRKVEEMIESFTDLLAMHTYDGLSREKYLYPFHLLAIVDPLSSWSKHWSHGASSRHILLRALSRNSPLLRFLSDTMLRWLEDFDPIQYLNVKSSQQGLRDNPTYTRVPGYLAQYLVFSSCTLLIQSLLRYEGGRSLFSISSVATSSIEFLNSRYEEIGFCGPVELLVDFVSCLLTASIHSAVVLAILQPILEAHADKGQEATYALQPHTVKLVEVLVSTDEGVRSLMGGRKPRGSFRHRHSAENLACLARVLGEYLSAILRSHRQADARLLDFVLGICARLQLSHDLFLYLESTGLFHALNTFYKYLKNKIENDIASPFNKPIHSYCSLLNRLVRCYLQILQTPRGILCCDKDGILYDVMQDLFENNLVGWRLPSELLLVHRVCCYPSGARAVREERVVAEQLARVWHTESEPAAPGQERRQREVEEEVIQVLGSICSSLVSVQVQLSERSGSTETLLALCGPCTLRELLESTMTDEEQEGEVAPTEVAPPPPETVQHMGLALLSSLASCPDVALLLQHTFDMQTHLLQRQRENCAEETLIVDELSVLRNHVLVQLLVCGGPGERLLPPPDMPSGGDYPWPLFSTPQAPKEYHSRAAVGRSSSKKQGELQKLLADTRPGVHDAQWLTHCRRAAKSTLVQSAEEIKGGVLLDLVQQVLRASPNSSVVLGNLSAEHLYPEEHLGIALTLRYGVQLRLIQAVPQMQENLGHLLRFSRTLRPCKSDHFTGFDWLVATVFLNQCGNLEKSQSFLQSLASLKFAPLIWSTLAERRKMRLHLEATFAHLLELVLAAEEPQLLLALQGCGVPVGCVVNGWMRRCLWNVLDWPGVTQWLLLGSMGELDVLLYVTVGMLQHLKPRVLAAVAEGNLSNLLLEPLEKLSMGEALSCVEKLSRRYRHKVLPHLQTALSV